MSTEQKELCQFQSLVLSNKYINEPSKLAVPLGVDDNGEPIIFDFAKCPHLFIGGDQGCGKSTFIHSIIVSLMRRNTPQEFQFVYFDAKGMESNLYFDSEYLYFNNNNITAAFDFLLNECKNRSVILSEHRKRTVADYNKYAQNFDDLSVIPELFVIIDELSYFKYQTKEKPQIEELINIGRAVSVHLIVSDTNPTLSYVCKIAQSIPYKVAFRFTKADYKILLERGDIVPLSKDGEIICDFRGAALIHGHGSFITEAEIFQEVSKNKIKRSKSRRPTQKKEKIEYHLSESVDSDNSIFAIDEKSSKKNIPLEAMRNKETVNARDFPDLVKLLKELEIVDIDTVTEEQIITITDTKQKAKLLGITEFLAEYYGDVTITVTPEAKQGKGPKVEPDINNEKTTSEAVVEGEQNTTGFLERISDFIKQVFSNPKTVIRFVLFATSLILMFFILNRDDFSWLVVVADAVLMLTMLNKLIGKDVAKRRKKYSIYAIDNISDGHDFEYVVSDLLKGVGFSNVKVTAGSGDYGIDIIGFYNGVSYAIQCKKYSGKVGIAAVQEAYAGQSYYGCDYAMVITNSYFTPAAINLAKTTGVILWDRSKVKKLINGHL